MANLNLNSALDLVFSPPISSNFGFPTKSPAFNTTVQTPKSQRNETRYSPQVYPTWKIDYPVNFMRGAEQVNGSTYQYLLGFYIAAKGRLSSFLYQDPYDNAVSDCYFGTGDGTTTAFQLVRSIGIGTDIVQNLNGTPTIYVNGTQTTAFTVSATGVVTFTTAPAANAILTWTGSFYYRVRFDTDTIDFEQFMDEIWSMQSLKLQSLIL